MLICEREIDVWEGFIIVKIRKGIHGNKTYYVLIMYVNIWGIPHDLRRFWTQ